MTFEADGCSWNLIPGVQGNIHIHRNYTTNKEKNTNILTRRKKQQISST